MITQRCGLNLDINNSFGGPFLKQPDSRNSGGPCFYAPKGVLKSDATQCQQRHGHAYLRHWQGKLSVPGYFCDTRWKAS